MCGVAFPSVSRLQAHLWTHKQRFVCSKCSFSCDSRVVFSSHVQREHLSGVVVSATADLSDGDRDAMDTQNLTEHSLDDHRNAENTVTVAALLSALREKAQGSTKDTGGGMSSPKAHTDDEEMEDENGSSGEESPGVSGGQDDVFKLYTCRFCGKKFDRAFSCNRHERVHTGYKPCFCRVCGRGFSEPRNLRHHVIRFHSDGSLRHLIKRDRRRKGEEDAAPHSPPSPPPPPLLAPQALQCPPETRFKDVLKETANKIISSARIDLSGLSAKTPALEITLTTKPPLRDYGRGDGPSPTACGSPSPPGTPNGPPSLANGPGDVSAAASLASSVTTYTTSLTKIIAASLDSKGERERVCVCV
ncbi:PR domain zinc finger protein 13 [Chionoecetes opilio]|uniref:PR domain zinc finger protein 13 n=1 Tax=Chionoecetes opilio TaxID=41210 RepID=A0A8J4XPF8_CHIOP|nr:PR domain zinc finger protein 13 [Chionoecetes opilio]